MITSASHRPVRRPFVPQDCGQPSMAPMPAEAATELGADAREEAPNEDLPYWTVLGIMAAVGLCALLSLHFALAIWPPQ